MRVYTIAGNVVDVSKSSLNANDRINERTTCSFTVIEPSFEIDIGMEVSITDGATTVFKGTVDQQSEYTDKGHVKYVALGCVDFSQLIDKRMVYDTFVNTLAGTIVRSLITSFFSGEGVTAGIIHNGGTISKAVFNYDNGNEAMNLLVDLTGLNWYIDENKQLHFIDRSSQTAPFNLSDGSMNYHGLQVKKKRGQYRNRQYLRAGHDKTSLITKEKPTPAPDGTSQTFVVRFPLAQKPSVFIDDVEVLSSDIGIKGLDQNKKWYWNKESNAVIQDSSSVPLSSTQKIEITYYGLYPLRVVADNTEEIDLRKAKEGGTGLYESVDQQAEIDDRDTAFDYAFARLDKFGIIPREITFNTYDSGLKAGQLLEINNTKHNLSGNYLIESVTVRDDAGVTLYSVKALDGSALGGWEQFFKSLVKGNKKMVIRDNEVLVLLNTTIEKQAWIETVEKNIFACPVPSEELYPSTTLYPC
jgi:hypothetical protein